jgi:hypothetical protein
LWAATMMGSLLIRRRRTDFGMEDGIDGRGKVGRLDIKSDDGGLR